MDFDPLNFFTAEKEEPTRPAGVLQLTEHSEDEHHLFQESPLLLSETDRSIKDEEEEEEGLVHILDLPPLTSKLPRDVLLTILKLLSPEQTTNFGPSEQDNGKATEAEILESKGVALKDCIGTRQWLMDNGYTRLSRNLLSISFTQELFSYINKILASPHFSTDEEILQLASLRISENCGRTARPNFQRKIIVKGLEKPILLNEPALTADSLGLKTWGSSLVLSELILQEHKELVLEPVLELGAGTGLVGITLGLLGYDVTLTDLPEILSNLETNVKLNGLDADCLVLDWTDPSSFIKTKGGNTKYKTIVIADPIYSSEHPRWVLNMITMFLERSSDARVLLQIPVRQLFERERETLWRIIKEENLKIKEEKEMHGYDDFGSQMFLYKELRWSTEELVQRTS